ncbi:alkylation response protein AidB-like acyl-CoA dehydrogenase [Streptosporangium album]|uniref:Alkylation response protein AidB-like acyl-CoA dehydrogenase n=1 Tax=Streptosporangium album TaxID=47479 RepID=A0A7W7S0G6_9ACTN|nr:acyl-CoA dehydrogenase family protein [Streptosporangium album]MBB4940943.1 alkylation response protein AidB-like acyl-CoA dehydrogenase [Streptosporangium album]
MSAERSEVDPFVQEAPRLANRWTADRVLRQAVRRLLPPDVFQKAAEDLELAAERCVTEMAPLAARAEATPPRHVPYDAWGNRVDRIEVDPAWTELVAILQGLGAVAIPHERTYGDHSRVVQAVLFQMAQAVSATALCPLGMSDGAVTCLREHDADLAAAYVPLLTRRVNGWTSGQWMTEKAGGSDLSRSGTVATPLGDGTWALRGTKWFTSATTADIAVALARPEGAGPGSRGLSLFALELRRPDGGWNGLRVRRLKDKYGTRGLPTAELDLDGTVATPVGGIGGGIAKISTVLHVARMEAAQAGPGATGHLLQLARDYARRRLVRGAPLADSPVHVGWLAEIAAEYEAMVQMALRTAQLVGLRESGSGDERLARVVVPLAKLSTARQAVRTCSELLESFGGAGYLEDTGIPRVLRDVQVQSIWEGTTNVLALDVMRALADPEVAAAFRDDVEAQLAAHPHPRVEAAARIIRAAAWDVTSREPDPAAGREVAWGMARTYQAALLAAQAGWALTALGDGRSAVALETFIAHPLVPPAPHAEARSIGLE